MIYGMLEKKQKKNLISRRPKMSLVSIRGAITVEENTKTAILEATTKLLEAVLKANQVEIAQIVHIYFTGTKDLNAVYPAVAARALGITEAALMCFQEMDVEGSLKQCIRLDMLVENTFLTRGTVKHQYLEKAKVLRPDLTKES